jgi:hypothetical protein
MRGFCEKWAVLRGFFVTRRGEWCGKRGLLAGAFWLPEIMQISGIYFWGRIASLRMTGKDKSNCNCESWPGRELHSHPSR